MPLKIKVQRSGNKSDCEPIEQQLDNKIPVGN